jgi:hypothetical protein
MGVQSHDGLAAQRQWVLLAPQVLRWTVRAQAVWQAL